MHQVVECVSTGQVDNIARQKDLRRAIPSGARTRKFGMLKNSLKKHLFHALDELDPKEEKVIRLRFGLDGADPKTLKEIGEMMSLSRERIRQIEAQALGKLNRSQKCMQLRGYLN